MKNILFIFIIILSLFTLASAQQIYQWTDENGVTHFSNSPVNLKDKGQVGLMHEKEKEQQLENKSNSMGAQYNRSPAPRVRRSPSPRVVTPQKSYKERQIEEEQERLRRLEEKKAREKREKDRRWQRTKDRIEREKRQRQLDRLFD